MVYYKNIINKNLIILINIIILFFKFGLRCFWLSKNDLDKVLVFLHLICFSFRDQMVNSECPVVVTGLFGAGTPLAIQNARFYHSSFPFSCLKDHASKQRTRSLFYRTALLASSVSLPMMTYSMSTCSRTSVWAVIDPC